MDIREKILIDREKRIELVRKKLVEDELYIIVIKCNVCGNDKNFAEFEIVKNYFLNSILEIFSVYSYTYYESFDGNFYLVQVNEQDKNEIKSKLMKMEEGLLGRYVDLDLYVDLEKSVSRSEFGLEERKCIVCEEATISCMREQKHSVEEVLEATRDGIKTDICKLVVSVVKSAMLDEVYAHPKLGLVTFSSSGKHLDMDYNTFVTSIDALEDYFFEYAKQGFDLDENSFDKLREIGKRAEVAMFEATNGVNTHKGSIFILGFLIPSVVNMLFYNKSFDEVVAMIRMLAKNIMDDFKEEKSDMSVGEEMFLKYKISGIRGEVYEGLNKAFIAKEVFKSHPGKKDELVIDLLVYYVSMLDDTVILHSKELGYLDYVKTVGEEIREAGGVLTSQGRMLIEEYTTDFIDKGISPGGSADMVISTLVLLEIEKLFFRR